MSIASGPVRTLFPEKARLYDNGKCTTCEADVLPGDFKDALSAKEYTISGMCQKCQDETFNSDNEADGGSVSINVGEQFYD